MENVRIAGIEYPVVEKLRPRDTDGRALCRVKTFNGICVAVQYADGWYFTSERDRRNHDG